MGEPFEYEGLSFTLDTTSDEDDVDLVEHYAFGDAKVAEISFDLESFDPLNAIVREAMATPAPLTAPLTVEVPGKRYWWKPWRRRPGHTFHFAAVTVRPTGVDDV